MATDRAPGDNVAALALPGESELTSALLDEAVAELNRIYVMKGFETARAVGDFVLARFFAGDASNFRQRGNGHVTFRELGRREDLQMSWQFIWNAVSVVVQLQTLPTEVANALPFSHHKLLLSVKDDGQRVALATEAANGNLGKRALELRVRSLRDSDEAATTRAGRPPLPEFVKAMTSLRKASALAQAASISDADFARFSREDAAKVLEAFDADLAELAKLAEVLRRYLSA